MKTAPCPTCNGEGHVLGTLGQVRWFRCRACGMEFNKQIRRDGGFLRTQARDKLKKTLDND